MRYYRIDTIKSKDFRQCSANGEGIRVIVWCQGCSIKCEGCHNQEIWDFKGGKEFTQEEIDKILVELDNDIYNGITFLGGEPMADQNVEGFINLADQIRNKFQNKKTIWCYSGSTYEQLIKKPLQKSLIEKIDVLVDGPFILRLRNVGLKFRGSSNQRLISVQKSLKENRVILHE